MRRQAGIARPPVASDGTAAFEAIVEQHKRSQGVEAGRMFGSIALKLDGKVFAMLDKGSLVVKLPADRVQLLVSSGEALRFDPGHGRVMKEWVSIAASEVDRWAKLAAEARAAASANAQRRSKR